VAGREDLGDGTAGVIAHQVHLREPETVAQVGDDLSERGDRQVVATRGAAVQRQVDRDAAARVAQVLHDMTPQHPVGAEAVHEQCDRARAQLGVGDLASRGVERPAMGGERAYVHGILQVAYRLSVY
jgi:hypothetical protein